MWMFELHGVRLKLILARSCSIPSCQNLQSPASPFRFNDVELIFHTERPVKWTQNLLIPWDSAKWCQSSLWIFMMCSCIISFESITPVTLFHVARMPISTTGPLATWRWDKRKKCRSTLTESRLEQSESSILLCSLPFLTSNFETWKSSYVV